MKNSKLKVETADTGSMTQNCLLYEGCEYPYSTERIVRNVWVAKCSVKVNGVPFEVTQKGASEADAVQKLKNFFS